MKHFEPSCFLHAFILVLATTAGCVLCIHRAGAQDGSEAQIQLRQSKANHPRILIDGREVFGYRHGPNVDLVHYYPVRSPSGRSMTVQHPDPYPHHRSFWFADKVKLGDQKPADFYNAFYSRIDEGENRGRFKRHIRHVGYRKLKMGGNRAKIVSKLVWERNVDDPVLDETRILRVTSLGNGEYLMDVTFTVTAAYGTVRFVSDDVHYAWPYVRMNETFNVDEGGGKIVNSAGGVNRDGTNMEPAKWVDYSAPVDGAWEGLAIFTHPDNNRPHKWLTRDYGCFGPRRANSQPTLEKGESMSRRVGVYVHRGNVNTGDVEEVFKQYWNGRWSQETDAGK